MSRPALPGLPLALLLLAGCQGKPITPPLATGSPVGTPAGTPAGTPTASTTTCTPTSWWEDADGDGFGNPEVVHLECPDNPLPPGNWVTNPDDCNDAEPEAWSNRSDTCDGIDNNCDGAVDEDHRVGWVLATVDAAGVYEIDPATGATTLRTAIAAPFAADGVNSADSRDASLLVLHDANTDELVELDSCLGTAAVLGPHGQGNLPGIAFGHDGNIYGIDVTSDQIVRIDAATLNSQSLLALGRDVLNSGMAYDCATERLWVADQAASEIFWFDAQAATTGGFVTTNVPFSAVGLEFDNTSGTLLASTGTSLYRVDPATGVGTWLSDFSGPIGNINDLVLLPPCP